MLSARQREFSIRAPGRALLCRAAGGAEFRAFIEGSVAGFAYGGGFLLGRAALGAEAAAGGNGLLAAHAGHGGLLGSRLLGRLLEGVVHHLAHGHAGTHAGAKARAAPGLFAASRMASALWNCA